MKIIKEALCKCKKTMNSSPRTNLGKDYVRDWVSWTTHRVHFYSEACYGHTFFFIDNISCTQAQFCINVMAQARWLSRASVTHSYSSGTIMLLTSQLLQFVKSTGVLIITQVFNPHTITTTMNRELKKSWK